MNAEQAIIWFVITALGLVALLTIGIYEGTHVEAMKARRVRRLLHRH